jgi:uncharacterized protein YggE
VFQTLYSQQLEQKTNYIFVQGSVELKEIADQASLSFNVRGVGANLRQAVENADKTTKTITDKLIALGVKDKNISTSSFFSGENRGDKAFLSSSRDYQANISTMIKVDSLKLLQPVLFAISESNVQNISQITFSLKDEVSFRKRARVEAALKAREKAEDIGKALNVIVGKAITIDEFPPSQTNAMVRGINASYNTISVSGLQMGVDESIGSGFFAQTISITSQVYVTFELK